VSALRRICRCSNGKTCSPASIPTNRRTRTLPASRAAPDRGASPQPQMLAGLEWRAHNPRRCGFIARSGFGRPIRYLQSFERIAMEWLRVKGDSAAEQTFLNDTCGKAYKAQGRGAALGKTARSRALVALSARHIPAGALLWPLGIDCQADRVEWQLVGFGRDFRRFVIDYGVIPGHISEDKVCQRKGSTRCSRRPGRTRRPQKIGDRSRGDRRQRLDRGRLGLGQAASARKADHGARSRRGFGAAVRARQERAQRSHRQAAQIRRRFYNFGASVLKMALYRDLAKDDPLRKALSRFRAASRTNISASSPRNIARRRSGTAFDGLSLGKGSGTGKRSARHDEPGRDRGE
jgi:hypothetical protein